MFWMSAAMALTPAEFDDRVRSMNNLTLAPELYRRVEEPIVLADGAMRIRLTSGVMVPVFSGRFAGEWERDGSKLLAKLRTRDKEAKLPSAEQRGSRELVGFVWLEGEGKVVVDMSHRADAMRLANRMAMEGGREPDSLATLVGKKVWTTTADQGVFLSASPMLDAMFLGDPDGDPYEVVVYEDRDDLGGAENLLTSRLRMWRGRGVDWNAEIANDRALEFVGVKNEPSLLADVRTADRYHSVSKLPAGGQDRWLAQLRQPRGHASTRWKSQVVTAGFSPEGVPLGQRLSGELFPPIVAGDPLAARLPPVRVEPVDAQVSVFAQPTRSGLELEVENTSTIRFRATGDVAYFDIQLPRVEAAPETFDLLEFTVDGTSVVADAQSRREQWEEAKKLRVKDGDVEVETARLDRSRLRVVLPEVLSAGDVFEARIRFKDTWPYANRGACGGQEDALGRTTSIQAFTPIIAGNFNGGPWDYSLSVGVPARAKMVAIASGEIEKTYERDGWRILQTKPTENARWPSIAIGKYHSRSEPAQSGMPAVDAHIFVSYPGVLDSMAPEARRVVSFLEGWLPPFPVGRIAITQAPSACGGFVWKAPHGMAELQQMQTEGRSQASNDIPKLSHAVFAHEIAHQYWGQLAQPASLDDRWMVETFAEMYSCLYVAKAFEDSDLCVKRMRAKRQTVFEITDGRATLSLSDAFHGIVKNQTVYGYGPFVMERMLRREIGNEAFFSGLDLMLREHPFEPVTQDRLQHYLEMASGQELDDFFAFWVDQGIIPRVKVETVFEAGTLTGTLRSNVPFGTFQMPVRIVDKKETTDLWVAIENGVGRFEVPAASKGARVVLDPEDTVMARTR